MVEKRNPTYWMILRCAVQSLELFYIFAMCGGLKFDQLSPMRVLLRGVET
jgi:hypothetical protein